MGLNILSRSESVSVILNSLWLLRKIKAIFLCRLEHGRNKFESSIKSRKIRMLFSNKFKPELNIQIYFMSTSKVLFLSNSKRLYKMTIILIHSYTLL